MKFEDILKIKPLKYSEVKGVPFFEKKLNLQTPLSDLIASCLGVVKNYSPHYAHVSITYFPGEEISFYVNMITDPSAKEVFDTVRGTTVGVTSWKAFGIEYQAAFKYRPFLVVESPELIITPILEQDGYYFHDEQVRRLPSANDVYISFGIDHGQIR